MSHQRARHGRRQPQPDHWTDWAIPGLLAALIVTTVNMVIHVFG